MSTLFHSSKGTLAQIAAKTNSLTVLGDIVRQTCPDLPEDVWQIANFRQNILIIEVKSSPWGQRLQFERMKINQQLALVTEGEFTQIEIKVAPYKNKVEEKKPVLPSRASTMSGETADQLREIADKAPKRLREKLEKLAAHANKNK